MIDMAWLGRKNTVKKTKGEEEGRREEI